jgi:hypothetical protein
MQTLQDLQLSVQDWFNAAYADKLELRTETMRHALQLVSERSGVDRVLVETGCVRTAHHYGDGNSTYIFGDFVRHFGGELHTVDISLDNMQLCMEATAPFADKTFYYAKDSVDFLRMWGRSSPGKMIDLLYLDSWNDVDSDENKRLAQEHCLNELDAAMPHLKPGCVVLLDDAMLEGGGKPMLAHARLEHLGWRCVFDSYQTLWVRQ